MDNYRCSFEDINELILQINYIIAWISYVWQQNYFNMPCSKITDCNKERLIESFENGYFISTAGILEIKSHTAYSIIRTYNKTRTTILTTGGKKIR